MRTALLAASLLLLSTACRPDDVDDTGSSDGGAADGGSSTDGGSSDGGSSDGGSSDGGSADGGSSEGACSGLGLEGQWVSEGEDISPLFQQVPFEYASIDASFGGDCSYTVQATTTGGDVYDLAGSYTATDGSPGTIVQTQAQPYEATAEGIWQVDGDVMQFEVVQTVPDYGFTPPTPETGFGSSSGQGMAAGDNLQIYRRP